MKIHIPHLDSVEGERFKPTRFLLTGIEDPSKIITYGGYVDHNQFTKVAAIHSIPQHGITMPLGSTFFMAKSLETSDSHFGLNQNAANDAGLSILRDSRVDYAFKQLFAPKPQEELMRLGFYLLMNSLTGGGNPLNFSYLVIKRGFRGLRVTGNMLYQDKDGGVKRINPPLNLWWQYFLDKDQASQPQQIVIGEVCEEPHWFNWQPRDVVAVLAPQNAVNIHKIAVTPKPVDEFVSQLRVLHDIGRNMYWRLSLPPLIITKS